MNAPESLDLQSFAWRKRPVLIFADTSSNAALVQQQRQLAEQAAALAERDMVVVTVAGAAVMVQGRPVAADGGVLRLQYKIDADVAFAVLLVGKDTGVKLRRAEPVDVAELFALVDAMPMRRGEMRGRE